MKSAWKGLKPAFLLKTSRRQLSFDLLLQQTISWWIYRLINKHFRKHGLIHSKTEINQDLLLDILSLSSQYHGSVSQSVHPPKLHQLVRDSYFWLQINKMVSHNATHEPFKQSPQTVVSRATEKNYHCCNSAQHFRDLQLNSAATREKKCSQELMKNDCYTSVRWPEYKWIPALLCILFIHCIGCLND